MCSMALRQIHFLSKQNNCSNVAYIYKMTFNRYFCEKDSQSNKPQTNDTNQNETKNKGSLIGKLTVVSKESDLSNDNKETAKKKLMNLLAEIEISSETPRTISNKLNLAKPSNIKRKKEQARLLNEELAKRDPNEIVKSAVKAVASVIKGDPEKIETEITKKLEGVILPKEVVNEPIELETKENEIVSENKDSLLDEPIVKEIVSSVGEVASTVTGSPQTVKSELTQRLMKMALDDKSREKQVSLLEIFKDIKIDKMETITRKDSLKRKLPISKTKIQIDLFGSPPLNIFNWPTDEKMNETKHELWERLHEKNLKLLVQYAPTNAYEEMIMWTEQGKHWRLPIDNEIDIGPEENVGFHEHIFLEKHLEGFPTKGPIRHFMELVTVGLSKNPYITVERKIENIEWFRQYFKDKEEILKDYNLIN